MSLSSFVTSATSKAEKIVLWEEECLLGDNLLFFCTSVMMATLVGLMEGDVGERIRLSGEKMTSGILWEEFSIFLQRLIYHYEASSTTGELCWQRFRVGVMMDKPLGGQRTIFLRFWCSQRISGPRLPLLCAANCLQSGNLRCETGVGVGHDVYDRIVSQVAGSEGLFFFFLRLNLWRFQAFIYRTVDSLERGRERGRHAEMAAGRIWTRAATVRTQPYGRPLYQLSYQGAQKVILNQ